MDYQKWLLEIFNASFRNGTLSHDWKLAIIIPIVKPGKLPTSVDSYRPISLLSCISKLIEKFICSRVNYFIECSSALSHAQGGVRKRLCTLDQIARIENTCLDTWIVGVASKQLRLLHGRVGDSTIVVNSFSPQMSELVEDAIAS